MARKRDLSRLTWLPEHIELVGSGFAKAEGDQRRPLMPLSSEEILRIYVEVILGADPPAEESERARNLRASLTKTVAELKAQGMTLEVPFDAFPE
jgi:hypothetical protein